MPTKPRTKSPPWLKQIPHNMHYPREHYFRGLSELDVDNLKCGRITRQTMGEARRRVREALKSNGGHDPDMLLADELNDMLEAARK
jgi:hypothetical protein